jgi:hypothetical protein
VYSALLLCVDPGNAFSDVWPGEIPPGWELEWVEDDYWKHHGWPPVVTSLPLVISAAFQNSELSRHDKNYVL